MLVALRLAFSTVNDALGARPDAAYRSAAPAAVLAAVTFGRPIADAAAVTELAERRPPSLCPAGCQAHPTRTRPAELPAVAVAR